MLALVLLSVMVMHGLGLPTAHHGTAMPEETDDATALRVGQPTTDPPIHQQERGPRTGTRAICALVVVAEAPPAQHLPPPLDPDAADSQNDPECVTGGPEPPVPRRGRQPE